MSFSRTLFLLGVAALTACSPAAAQTPTSTSAVDSLGKGGYVIVFRHAHTDRSRMDDQNWSMADRATQRNLSDRGVEQSRQLGREISASGIPIGEVWASPMFRTRETAELMFSRVDTTELLRSRGSTPEAKALLTEPPRQGTNRVLVTHNAYISRYFSSVGHGQIDEGDAVIVRPLGDGRFEVVRRVRLGEWDGSSGATQLPGLPASAHYQPIALPPGPDSSACS